MKLTAKAIAGLKLPVGKTDAIHFDDDMAGFGYRLRAGAGGKVLRSWVVQYRRGGASRRILLGSGDVLNADQARAQAKKLLAMVALGEDPQADRQERRAKDKFNLRSVIDEYLAAKETRVRPRTFHEVQRYLTGSHFRPLHNMPIDTVGRRDVAGRLVAITREHGAVTAARARTALSAFFVWALQMGIVENNPVVGSPKPAENKPRERVLSDAELATIWRASGDYGYGSIIKLLVLTGCRRQEVGSMAWPELDLERAVWTIPARRSKNGREHTLPLMPLALDIIQRVPRMVHRDQLFGTRGHGFGGWSRGKLALDQRSGITDWAVHDIRRSVATRMADLGVAPHVVEAVLNHHSGHRAGVAGVYNRSSYEREVRAALALWADHIATIIAGGERKVLAFPQDRA